MGRLQVRRGEGGEGIRWGRRAAGSMGRLSEGEGGRGWKGKKGAAGSLTPPCRTYGPTATSGVPRRPCPAPRPGHTIVHTCSARWSSTSCCTSCWSAETSAALEDNSLFWRSTSAGVNWSSLNRLHVFEELGFNREADDVS